MGRLPVSHDRVSPRRPGPHPDLVGSICQENVEGDSRANVPSHSVEESVCEARDKHVAVGVLIASHSSPSTHPTFRLTSVPTQTLAVSLVFSLLMTIQISIDLCLHQGYTSLDSLNVDWEPTPVSLSSAPPYKSDPPVCRPPDFTHSSTATVAPGYPARARAPAAAAADPTSAPPRPRLNRAAIQNLYEVGHGRRRRADEDEEGESEDDREGTEDDDRTDEENRAESPPYHHRHHHRPHHHYSTSEESDAVPSYAAYRNRKRAASAATFQRAQMTMPLA